MRPIVLDTNLVVSAFLRPESIAATALEIALIHFEVVYSVETLSELADVLSRKKFDKYLGNDERKLLTKDYAEASLMIRVNTAVLASRDPKDDKFLALAIDAHAMALVTGDKRDLLSLKRLQDIPILGVREFTECYVQLLDG